MTAAAEALGPLAPGTIPDSVRGAGPQAVEEFRAGLSFERVLLGKLLSAALPEEEEGGDPRAAQLPETMADAIVAAGGTGLAAAMLGPGAGQGR